MCLVFLDLRGIHLKISEQNPEIQTSRITSSFPLLFFNKN
jgi:hypothetical protein